MINSKDAKTYKELIVSTLFSIVDNYEKRQEIKVVIEKAFEIIIDEMKAGGI